MKGSYHRFVIQQAWQAHDQRMFEDPTARRKCPCLNCKRVTANEIVEVSKHGAEALASEARELKRARIMNRSEPGYERKDGKL